MAFHSSPPTTHQLLPSSRRTCPLRSSRTCTTVLLIAASFDLAASPATAQEYTSALKFAIGLPPVSADASTGDSPGDAAASSTDEPPAEAVTPPTDAAPDATAPPVPDNTAPVNTAQEKADSTQSSPNTAATPVQESRLLADRVRYDGDSIIAEGTAGRPVRFESGTTNLQAQRIQIDMTTRAVQASGAVVVENMREIEQTELFQRPPNVGQIYNHRFTNRKFRIPTETVTETLRGSDFSFNWGTRQGRLDHAVVQLAGFSVSANSLIVNGQRYTVHDVLLRPGGLTEAERKIYGTPPPNLRARSVTVVTGDTGRLSRVIVKGAGLYWNNTRILPVPSYIFSAVGRRGSGRNTQTFSLIPRLSFNSADRVLVTTRVGFPLSKNPEQLSLLADLGLSARVGFRGGLGLESRTNLGDLSLRLRRSDIVVTQLTNRIQLNRVPELEYRSPALPLLRLPGQRWAGLMFDAGIGRFSERLTGSRSGTVNSTRRQVGIVLSTRVAQVQGPYLDLFARAANYSRFGFDYRNRGFEVGYDGNVTPRIRGLFSYRSTALSGQTPFRFDAVEIARELRTTFDVQLSPRYIVPLDLRYDMELRQLRERKIGILRSFKTFAYGLSYDSAQGGLGFEVRSGF